MNDAMSSLHNVRLHFTAQNNLKLRVLPLASLEIRPFEATLVVRLYRYVLPYIAMQLMHMSPLTQGTWALCLVSRHVDCGVNGSRGYGPLPRT